MSVRQQPATGDGDSGDERDFPLSDAPLLDLLDALVKDRGRVAASEVLGVNYRTMMACYDSRRVSRRMRRALVEFQEANVGGSDEPGVVDGDTTTEGESESLKQRVEALEEERRDMREIVEAQAKQLEELERRFGAVEECKQQRRHEGDAVGADDDRQQEWRPPIRGHGLPDAGVVTLEEQPDEEHAFGPAAPVVAEWRSLRTGADSLGSRIDRARASVRRWELEIAMLGDFHLTLPPETEPLDASRREDHLRWRREALAEAQRELVNAKRLRWLRRALTLGMWWR